MLYTKIKSDLTNSQRSGDHKLVDVLKLLLSELAYAQVDYKNGELPDTEVVRVLMKEAKKRKDSIEVYTKVGAGDRVESEQFELSVIEGYLPQMMSVEEVTREVDQIALETGLTGGRLMGAVMGRLKGRADGSIVQKVVNEKYSS